MQPQNQLTMPGWVLPNMAVCHKGCLRQVHNQYGLMKCISTVQLKLHEERILYEKEC
jgi:hypothetical protein